MWYYGRRALRTASRLKDKLKRRARRSTYFRPPSQRRFVFDARLRQAGRGDSGMSRLSNFVSLHPYFRVHSGKLAEFKAALPAFGRKTAAEDKNVFYEFTVNGDEVFCREGYTDAEGLLAHLDNVGTLLAEALQKADLTRLEVHGPAAELDKLRAPMAHLNPAWFVIDG